MDSRSISLRAGLAWTIAGNSIYLGCQYGMLIAIAKLGSQANVGEFALAQAIAAPLIILSQMQLRQLQVTDVKRAATFGDYLMARLLATLLALVAIGVLALSNPLSDGIAALLAVVALAKASESISDIAHGHLQLEGRLDLVGASLILKGLLSLGCLALTLFWTGSLFVAAAVMAVSWAAVLFAFDMPLASRLRAPGEPLLAWRPQLVRSLTRTAMPLAAASGLVSLSGNLPRYFLEASGGPEAVALFAVGATPLMLVGLVNSAVSQATVSRAARHFQMGELHLFARLARWVVALQVTGGLFLAGVFWFAGDVIMRLLFTPEFQPASRVAVLLAIGISISGLAGYGATVITAARRFWLQLGNIVLTVLIQLPLCMILIPRFGIVGASTVEILKYAVATVYLSAVGYMVHRHQARTALRATAR